MKRIIIIMLAITLILITPCEAINIDKTKYDEGKLVYSNLIDEESKSLMKAELKSANINEKYIDSAIEMINDYNTHMTTYDEKDKEYMKKSDLFNFKEGFVSTDSNYIDYGDYYYQMKKWYNGRNYTDACCRSLAFQLMQDFIHVSKPINKNEWKISNEDDILYNDYDALNNYTFINIDKSKYPQYFSLFHPIMSIEKNDDLREKIVEQWSNYGITFDDSKASLITIWSVDDYDGEKRIINAHAGVLLDDENELIFIEKTNPLAPYQITKFYSKEQLKKYMIDTLTAFFKKYDCNVPEMVVLQNNEVL